MKSCSVCGSRTDVPSSHEDTQPWFCGQEHFRAARFLLAGSTLDYDEFRQASSTQEPRLRAIWDQDAQEAIRKSNRPGEPMTYDQRVVQLVQLMEGRVERMATARAAKAS